MLTTSPFPEHALWVYSLFGCGREAASGDRVRKRQTGENAHMSSTGVLTSKELAGPFQPALLPAAVPLQLE
jgi:hypothetical protein